MLWIVNTSIFMDSAKNGWGLSSTEEGLLSTSFMIGMLIGSYTWGYFGDTKSRMWAFKRSVAFTAIGSIFTSFALNFYMMLAGLLVIGLGVGGEITMGGPVMSEYLPPSKAYMYTVLCATWTVGGIFSGLIALIVKLSDPSGI
mmetsp:Transcript_29017/g.5250  ORF Transcript_29017/g.5250 Transcript_29017/m.5250 type:complete len:143 (+) Transcript_29017:127-555(+)